MPSASTTAARYGLSVSFPTPSTVLFSSATLFRDSDGPFARTFFQRAFCAPGVVQVAIDSSKGSAEIVLDEPLQPRDPRLEALARLLSTPGESSEDAASLTLPEELKAPGEALVRLQRYGTRLST